MNIVRETENRSVLFNDLSLGDVFTYNNVLCIKIAGDDEENAFNLEQNLSEYMAPGDRVVKAISAVLTVRF